jgi:ferredoxin-NADP reductase
MRVTFEQREELAPGIWQYRFSPERAVDFVPGQYVDLFLPDVQTDPRGGSRTFSLTSLPAEPSITFITKHFALQTPYKQRLQAMRPGDPAHIGDAMGDLVLPKLPDVPLVFVAGGIGMASYASMLRDLLTRREERPMFLFYQLRARREQLFRELTDAYPLQLAQVALAPNRLSAGEIADATPPGALFYLSGGQSFVESLRTGLEALGVPRSRIVFDYYEGYTEL